MKRVSTTLLLAFSSAALLISCSPQVTETGKASYYAGNFEGKKTAGGDIYKGQKYTAAHKTLPFGTKVKVKNLETGKTVKVTVNDRGPFVSGRIIDVSDIAAKDLGLKSSGTAKVQIKYKKAKKPKINT